MIREVEMWSRRSVLAGAGAMLLAGRLARAGGGRVLGLFIGVGVYREFESLLDEKKVAVPDRDAEALAAAFRERFGAEVTVLTSAGNTRQVILDAVASVLGYAGDADTVVVYFGGHGERVQKGTMTLESYWLPADAKKLDDGRGTWVPHNEVKVQIAASRARAVLLLVDSCYGGNLTRDSDRLPEVRTEAAAVEMMTRAARVVVTSGGNSLVINEGVNGGRSAFTDAVLGRLAEPARFVTAESIFAKAAEDVPRDAHGQAPQWGTLPGHADGGVVLWVNGAVPEAVPAPIGESVPALNGLAALLAMPMKAIPGGTVRLGCLEGTDSAGGLACEADEWPGTLVSATVAPFEIARHELSRGLWRLVLDWARGEGLTEAQGLPFAPEGGDDLPMTMVSWVDVAVWCVLASRFASVGEAYALSWRGGAVEWVTWREPKGKPPGWRMPTEAEWELAARGPDISKPRTMFAGFSAPADACTRANVGSGWGCNDPFPGLAPVAHAAANHEGLLHLTGNVYEWTWSTYGGPDVDPQVADTSMHDRVCRGGGWLSDPRFGRLANRDHGRPRGRSPDVGVRLARSSQGP